MNNLDNVIVAFVCERFVRSTMLMGRAFLFGQQWWLSLVDAKVEAGLLDEGFSLVRDAPLKT